MSSASTRWQTARGNGHGWSRRSGKRPASPLRADTGRSMTAGEVIYSGQPILAADRHRYRVGDQAAVRVVIQWQHIPIAVYATHLDGSRDPRFRIAQAGELSAWVAATGERTRTIVCGDFNDVPGSATVEPLSAHFSPTQGRATAFTPLVASSGQPTDPELSRFDRCIDFIWVGAGLECIRSELCFVGAGGQWASDHLGIAADIAVTQPFDGEATTACRRRVALKGAAAAGPDDVR